MIYEILPKFGYHKKWKDSLEGSLDRVVFAAELEFPRMCRKMKTTVFFR